MNESLELDVHRAEIRQSAVSTRISPPKCTVTSLNLGMKMDTQR